MSQSHDEIVESIRARMDSDDSLPRVAPASHAVLDATESVLGFALPKLLRRVYAEVCNGGFGPGEHVLGAQGGYEYESTLNGSIDREYQRLRTAFPSWPTGLLPLCDLELNQWVCVATSDAREPIVLFERAALTMTDMTLAEFLAGWARGEDLFEALHERIRVEQTGVNPFTKAMQTIAHTEIRPRGLAMSVTLHRAGQSSARLDNGFGDEIDEPTRADMKRFLAELRDDDEEHGEAWLSVGERTLSFAIRGVMTYTRSHRAAPEHLASVTKDRALGLWVLLAASRIDDLESLPWRKGAGELTSAVDLARERAWYDALGPESPREKCRAAGCARGSLEWSPFCRSHHFESVHRKACPFDD